MLGCANECMLGPKQLSEVTSSMCHSRDPGLLVLLALFFVHNIHPLFQYAMLLQCAHMFSMATARS